MKHERKEKWGRQGSPQLWKFIVISGSITKGKFQALND